MLAGVHLETHAIEPSDLATAEIVERESLHQSSHRQYGIACLAIQNNAPHALAAATRRWLYGCWGSSSS